MDVAPSGDRGEELGIHDPGPGDIKPKPIAFGDLRCVRNWQEPPKEGQQEEGDALGKPDEGRIAPGLALQSAGLCSALHVCYLCRPCPVWQRNRTLHLLLQMHSHVTPYSALNQGRRVNLEAVTLVERSSGHHPTFSLP